MPGSLKTEAIVLRSLRYGEADRILHLYTPHRGRLGAIAQRVRLTPQLVACVSCGERDRLSGYSAASGGVVCDACAASACAPDGAAHAFMAGALSSPLAEAPDAPARALRQADRAISETFEHHAQLR